MVVILMAVIALGFVLIERGGNQQVASFTLFNLLSSEDCERACWLGIEPGITAGDEARIALENANISFENVELPGGGGGIYDFSQNDGIQGFISFSDQAVNQINLGIDFCLSRVLSEYGIPAEVQEDGIYFTFLYPDSGLIFNVNVDDRTRVAGVLLTSRPVFEANFSGDSLEHNWDEFKDRFAGDCEDSLAPLGAG